MPVTTKLNGWSVRVSDDEYIAGIRSGRFVKPDFVFLFDTTGYAAAPFTEAGYVTLIVDMANVGQYAHNSRAHTVADWDILAFESFLVELCSDARLIFGFPPCTDLAVSGASHFEYKRERNPSFQKEAVYLFRSVQRIGDATGKPYAAENPVSVVSSMYRPACYAFHPHEYGGYLPDDDVHPEYPQYIAPRDAYPKRTQLWTGNGFIMPPKKPVFCPPGYSDQHLKLGGKSEKTKRIRSASPRGFFKALCETYTTHD